MKSPETSLKRQRGMSIFALFFLLVLFSGFGLLGMKVVPHYLDYMTISKIMRVMSTSEEVQSGTATDIRKSFDKRMGADYSTAINGADLEVEKIGGKSVVIAAWTAKVPLFLNWTLLIDFKTSTADK